MKVYTKETILEEISKGLLYHSVSQNCLSFIEMLIRKINDKQIITLEGKEIEKFLFIDSSKEMDKCVLALLKNIEADLSEVCFDNIIIRDTNFCYLNGVSINLDKVPNKDLSNIVFKGATLTGSLDDAIIENTNFTGYIGSLSMDPQKVRNKSIKNSKLSDININGSFENVVISGADFRGAKGNIRINPQNVPNKELRGINFSNVSFVGDDKQSIPSFDGCVIEECNFKASKGIVIINLDTIVSDFFPKLFYSDITGVILEGTVKSHYEPKHSVDKSGGILFNPIEDDLHGAHYYDENGNYVVVDLYESRMWDKESKTWKYIPRESEVNLKFNVKYKEEYQVQRKRTLFRNNKTK